MNPVETERLVIAEASLEDAAFIIALLNSPIWIEFIGDRGIKSEQDARDYIQNSLINSYEENGYGLYKVSLKEDEIPIGICGILKRDYLDHVDLGFATLPEHESMGYTFEASRAILEQSKSTLSLHPIYAITSQQNSISQGLLIKLGFLDIGKIKPDGGEEELMLFSN
ncbi:MAG: ribosomal-protein-alanine N-acetyltransferase [Crocinitomicaceae bacterium]|jgi:ribosomal-protein-alanine N-acetyltransferase